MRPSGYAASTEWPRPPRPPAIRRKRASTSRSSPGSPGTRTATGPSCSRRNRGWPASNDVIGVRIAVGLLGLGLALLPGAVIADPTDEGPQEGRLDPEY